MPMIPSEMSASRLRPMRRRNVARMAEGRTSAGLRTRRRAHQDWTGGTLDDAFGDATQDGAFEARSPVCPDDDQIGADLLGECDDLLRRVALQNVFLTDDAERRSLL